VGKNTKVEWSTHSHNFWIGCTKVSLGCAKCYAERDMDRYGQNFNLVRRTKGFYAPLQWHSKVQPGETIFVNSWSDFWIEQGDEWRIDALDVMRRTPKFIYLVLTKRPERAQQWLDTWNQKLPDNFWFGVS